MKIQQKLLIVGGDERFISSAEKLLQCYETFTIGFHHEKMLEVCTELCNFEEISECDIVVLPVPVSVDGVNVNAPFAEKPIPLETLISSLKKDAVIYGGKFNGTAKLFEKAGFAVNDYIKNEEFNIRNSVPSAEGALQILMEEMPVTIDKSNILVLGFGKLGSYLAQILHALGADVTVVARKAEAIAKAEQMGCHAVNFDKLPEIVSKAEAICNTVPVIVLNGEVLEKTNRGAFILDLASRPTGGTDFTKANSLGIKTIWALGLPAKVAPVTAGKIIAQTIMTMQNERKSQAYESKKRRCLRSASQ